MSSLSSSFPDEEKEQQLLKAQLRHERNLHLQLHDRFSLPFYIRIPFATSLSFLIGLSLGISHGSAVSGLRFRAENAHRLPTTPTGWYLYHKSKNYHRAFGGVKEGFKMGGKVAFWTAGFFAVEEMMDQYRGRKDFFNTVVASCTVAGGFSAWSMCIPVSLCLLLSPVSYLYCLVASFWSLYMCGRGYACEV
jgi:hypothetical protein